MSGRGGHGTRLRRALRVGVGVLVQGPPRPLMLRQLPVPPDASDANLPSIAVVTPSLNQSAFVQRTVESVLSQGYPALHYAVQDGGSNDGTPELLAPYRSRGLDLEVAADSGQAQALNRGFARAGGEIMAYLNADDLYLPGTLALVGRLFRDNPDIDVVYGNRLTIDENDREIGRWLLPRHDGTLLRQVDYVPQETLFWRRRIWDRVGGRFDEKLHFALDWELLLRFQAAGAAFRFEPTLFALFRCHGAQKTQRLLPSRGRAEMALLRARYRDRNDTPLARWCHHWRFLRDCRKVYRASYRIQQVD